VSGQKSMTEVRGVKVYKYFAGGEWQSARGDRVFDVYRPYDRALFAASRRRRPTGDSAGGNLALVLASRVTDANFSAKATLVGVAVMSPVTDLSLSGKTYETRADADPFFTRSQVSELVHAYLGSADPRDPLASPLHARFSGLPRFTLMSATTRSCWMIRADTSSVPLPPGSMPGSTCGWGCRTDSRPTSAG
jgi:hypothetical protein